LGIAAVLIGVAIVALLIGGGVYWWTSRSDTPEPSSPIFTGVAADRIDLAPGSLKGWNVLLISADTTRADRVGCYGNRAIQTPELDRLAREGVLFLRAITSAPITLPGHATMLTGLNPPRHGIRSNGLFRLRDQAETLASRLKAHGYATGAAIGAFVLDSKFGLDRGFDGYDDDLASGHSPTQYAFRERPAGRVNEVALAWIRQHASEKFFFFAHYFDPHFPYAPPAPWDERYKHNPYDGEIAYVDSEVGRLLAALDDMNLRRRTLVIFTSDHGESLGEHGERTHAIFVYDATLRVPLIFSAPEPFPKNHIVTRLAGIVDIAPTVLALLGVPAPPSMDGISLLEPPPADPRSVYVESLYPKFTHNWSPLLGIRRDDYKFIYAPKPELYDLRTDPRELKNVYDDHRELAAEMHDKLREMLGDDPETAADVRATLAVDEKTRAILRTLGYVVPDKSTQPSTQTVALPDPKDVIQNYLLLHGAQNHVLKGNYKEAAESVRKYLELSPNDPEGTQIAGQIFRQLGELDESLKWYQRAVVLGYERAESWAGVGSVYVLKKDPARAQEAYKKALEVDPLSTTALIGMGTVHVLRGREAEALACFEKALKHGQGINAEMAHLGISNVHRRAGRTKEADEALARAVAANPSNPSVAKVAAAYSQQAGDPNQAIEQLRKAAAEHPTADVLLKLGALLNQKKQHAEAAEFIRKGIALDPDNAALHYELGMALVDPNQIQQAGAAFLKATQLDPNHTAAFTQLGILFANAGKFRESAQLLRRAATLEPDSYRAHYNLGLALANLQSWDQAEKELRKALEIKPDDTATLCNLGRVLAENGKQPEAIQCYRKALEIDPANASAKQLLQGAGGS